MCLRTHQRPKSGSYSAPDDGLWGGLEAGKGKVCVGATDPSLSPHSQVAPSSIPAEDACFPRGLVEPEKLRPRLGWKEAWDQLNVRGSVLRTERFSQSWYTKQ